MHVTSYITATQLLHEATRLKDNVTPITQSLTTVPVISPSVLSVCTQHITRTHQLTPYVYVPSLPSHAWPGPSDRPLLDDATETNLVCQCSDVCHLHHRRPK